MSKRNLTPSPSTPKSKKAKTTPGQLSLDGFFSTPHHPIASSSKKDQSNAELPYDRNVIIDVDLFLEQSGSTSKSTEQPGPLSSPSTTSRSTELKLPAENKAKPVYFAKTLAVVPVYRSLSSDPLTFVLDNEPSPWAPNTPAPYSFLAHTLATLSETRSRILIINTLTNALRTIIRYHPPSLLPALYLLSNSLSPPYLPIELGLGHSVISKAIQQVSGLTPAALKRLYTTTGDVGDVAFEAKSNVRTLVPHPPLLITSVFDSLIKISRSKGQGTAKFKQSVVEKLLVAAKGEESRFLVRTLAMNLRVGAVRTSILTALARAMVLTPPGTLTIPIPSDSPYSVNPRSILEAEEVPTPMKKNSAQDQTRNEVNEKFGRAESLIRKSFVQHPNYDHIVAALLDAGLDGLAERVPLVVGALQQFPPHLLNS